MDPCLPWIMDRHGHTFENWIMDRHGHTFESWFAAEVLQLGEAPVSNNAATHSAHAEANKDAFHSNEAQMLAWRARHSPDPTTQRPCGAGAPVLL